MSEAQVIVEQNVKPRCQGSRFSWTKYSESILQALENRILKFVKASYRSFYVDIGPTVSSAPDRIWTVSLNTESTKTPLVVLHGFAAGVALWCQNLDSLAANRPVYAMDVLGFGRSSRPKFSTDATEAEQQFIRSVEEWRCKMKLEQFILLGHSFGGFLATSYAISHPDRVKHLILADPWGFPERKKDHERKIPLWAKPILYTLEWLNPLAGVRAAGPLGPWMVSRLRKDIAQKYSEFLEEDSTLISHYIYQCNAQTPSGETAFHTMMYQIGWAKNPMEHRIDKLREDVPITVMYGSDSWIDKSTGEIIKEKRVHSYVNIQEIAEAGHHVYSDQPEVFNQYVNEACDLTDSDKVAVKRSFCEIVKKESFAASDIDGSDDCSSPSSTITA